MTVLNKRLMGSHRVGFSGKVCNLSGLACPGVEFDANCIMNSLVPGRMVTSSFWRASVASRFVRASGVSIFWIPFGTVRRFPTAA